MTGIEYDYSIQSRHLSIAPESLVQPNQIVSQPISLILNNSQHSSFHLPDGSLSDSNENNVQFPMAENGRFKKMTIDGIENTLNVAVVIILRKNGLDTLYRWDIIPLQTLNIQITKSIEFLKGDLISISTKAFKNTGIYKFISTLEFELDV